MVLVLKAVYIDVFIYGMKLASKILCAYSLSHVSCRVDSEWSWDRGVEPRLPSE